MRERGRVDRAPYGLYEPLGLVAEDVPVKVKLLETAWSFAGTAKP